MAKRRFKRVPLGLACSAVLCLAAVPKSALAYVQTLTLTPTHGLAGGSFIATYNQNPGNTCVEIAGEHVRYLWDGAILYDNITNYLDQNCQNRITATPLAGDAAPGPHTVTAGLWDDINNQWNASAGPPPGAQASTTYVIDPPPSSATAVPTASPGAGQGGKTATPVSSNSPTPSSQVGDPGSSHPGAVPPAGEAAPSALLAKTDRLPPDLFDQQSILPDVTLTPLAGLNFGAGVSLRAALIVINVLCIGATLLYVRSHRRWLRG